MKKISAVCVFSLLLLNLIQAQDFYWIGFTDKKNTPFSLADPGKYLSERSIQRRMKQQIPIDEKDLPVNPAYTDQIKKLGVEVIHASKWLNGITVKSNISGISDQIKQLSFVREIQLTKSIQTTKSGIRKFDFSETRIPLDTLKYGASVYQTGIMNGQHLHNKGFLGKGKVIAVLDAGFYKVNQFPAFDSLWINHQILGTRDFVNPASNIFNENSHGMNVLSTMGGNIPGSLIGTAPKASYWLLRSEDAGSEFLIEEDNWVVAAEFADSVGADIINSSLGYYEFDNPSMNHVYNDMDGKTTRVTRAANIAVSRGMLVFASAGNERNKPWHYIIAPSDGDSVVAVAAVNRYGQPAVFSSAGPAPDGAVKPNLAAIGWGTVLEGSAGKVVSSNGTSFSSPVLAGMAACLWQANPDASARQIKVAIEQSGHLYNHPDSILGYGIPDFKLADQFQKIFSMKPINAEEQWRVFPNPFSDKLLIHFFSSRNQGIIYLNLINIEGAVCYSKSTPFDYNIVLNDLKELPAGIYFLQVKNDKSFHTMKVVKVNQP